MSKLFVLECESCGRISISQDNKNWSGWSLDETVRANANHSDADFDTIEECAVCTNHKIQTTAGVGTQGMANE